MMDNPEARCMKHLPDDRLSVVKTCTNAPRQRRTTLRDSTRAYVPSRQPPWAPHSYFPNAADNFFVAPATEAIFFMAGGVALEEGARNIFCNSLKSREPEPSGFQSSKSLSISAFPTSKPAEGTATPRGQ